MDPKTSQLAAEVERCIWATIFDIECANFPLASGCGVFAFSTARHGRTSLSGMDCTVMPLTGFHVFWAFCIGFTKVLEKIA